MKSDETATKVELNLVLKDDKDVKKKLQSSVGKHSVWKVLKGVFSLQVYKVVVNNGTKSWFIFRRYNEFHSLYEKVRYFFFKVSQSNSVQESHLCIESGCLRQNMDG